ncbi:hypothetical protein AE52_04467 [Escherichia coli BIDMC 77]|nr:hypothetical protein AE52_04467 [Escherichia coli BIDMC 77]
MLFVGVVDFGCLFYPAIMRNIFFSHMWCNPVLHLVCLGCFLASCFSIYAGSCLFYCPSLLFICELLYCLLFPYLFLGFSLLRSGMPSSYGFCFVLMLFSALGSLALFFLAKVTFCLWSLVRSFSFCIAGPCGEGFLLGAMCHCMVPGASRLIHFPHLVLLFSHIPTR